MPTGDEASGGGEAAAGQEFLRLALAQHYRNLHELQERAAKYGPLEVPLSLTNQITAEEEQIAQLGLQLLGQSSEPSLGEKYFLTGMRAYLSGDLGEARRYLKMTLHAEPFYPRAEELLEEVEQQVNNQNALRKIIRARELRSPVREIIGIGLVLLVAGGLITYRFVELRGESTRATATAAIVQMVTATAQAEGTMIALSEVAATVTAQAQSVAAATATALVQLEATRQAQPGTETVQSVATAKTIATETAQAQASATTRSEATVTEMAHAVTATAQVRATATAGAQVEATEIAKRATATAVGAIIAQCWPNCAEVNLGGVDLRRADLRGGNLTGANLSGANLAGSNLHGVDLRGAKLEGAYLDGADLRGTDLRETKLSEVTLMWAIYNNNTRWPEGFNPEAAGAIKVINK